jgi:hypothetical protein
MGLLKELVLATVKSNVRERQAFFWILIFPLMIYIIFGVLLQGEDKPRVAVYISNSSTAEKLAEWLRWYNITAEVVEGIDDPINFLKKQAAVGRAAVYVATDGNVTIYSTSVYGPMVAGLVERALYFQQFGEFRNITMNIQYVEGGVMRNVTYKIDVVMANVSAISVFRNETHILVTIPRWSPQFGGGVHYVDLSTGISGSVKVTWLVRMGLAIGFYLMLTVAFTMYSLHVTGFLKRLYLSPKGRYVSLLAVALGSLVLSLMSLFSIAVFAYLVGHPALVFTNVGFLVAFISNVLFGVGIGLLISAADIRLRSGVTPPVLPTPLFLLLAFLSGYFMPAELLPEGILNVVQNLPTYVARVFAETAVLYGLYDWWRFTTAFSASVAILVGGLLLHPLVKRQ